MNRSWLIALLLISVSFNLAVLGSVIYLRATCPAPPPFPQGERRMPPPPRFQPFFDNDNEIKQLRQEFDGTKQALMQELAKEKINEVRVNSIIDSSLAAQTKLEKRIGQKILAYRKTLSAEEAREQFTRRAEDMKHRSQDYPRHRHRRNP